jgi:hypothetical protein
MKKYLSSIIALTFCSVSIADSMPTTYSCKGGWLIKNGVNTRNVSETTCLGGAQVTTYCQGNTLRTSIIRYSSWCAAVPNSLEPGFEIEHYVLDSEKNDMPVTNLNN